MPILFLDQYSIRLINFIELFKEQAISVIYLTLELSDLTNNNTRTQLNLNSDKQRIILYEWICISYFCPLVILHLYTIYDTLRNVVYLKTKFNCVF